MCIFVNNDEIILQVFHVCEEGRRQSSFLCPRGTIFNQVSAAMRLFVNYSLQAMFLKSKHLFHVSKIVYNVKIT